MAHTQHRATGGRWYVKRGSEVRGPFRWALIERYVALGRIRDGDRLSADGVSWERMGALRERLGDAASEHARADERRGERRGPEGAECAPAPGRRGKDRRRAEPAAVLERRRRSERIWDSLTPQRDGGKGPLLGIAGVLVVVVLLAVFVSMPRGHRGPDCAQAPGEGVNWDFCSKAAVDLSDVRLPALSARNAKLAGANLAGAVLPEADLAYADLTAADLTLADLAGSRLVGANLRMAGLRHARLTGADLRFADLSGASVAGADLSGARLASAIWIDGRVCDRRSVGMCLRR